MPPVRKLTRNQAAFRDAILAGFTPSHAYKQAFNAGGMSRKSISAEAAKLLKHPGVALGITLATSKVIAPTVLPEPPPIVKLSLQRRMEELACAAVLDPSEMFDELNHFRPIRELPEHVRRAIAGFEVDPVSFVTKVKFIDKRGAIMDYSKLAGDIPAQKVPSEVPSQPPARYDLSKLTDEEFKQYLALKNKTAVRESV